MCVCVRVCVFLRKYVLQPDLFTLIIYCLKPVHMTPAIQDNIFMVKYNITVIYQAYLR